MEFGLLGRVRAVSDSVPVDLGPRKQRLVLAVLLLDANRFVSTDRLVRACWPDDPPPTARRVVHAHVSRLRGVLRNGVTLARHGAGYTLVCDPLRIDVHRFLDLARQARESVDDRARVALLDRALALWLGAPLGDVADDQARERLCGGLVEARLAAVQDRWDALLRLGNHVSILDELVTEAASNPRQQRITGLLMVALYRAGRATDALAVYRRYRDRLADEFGIDPGADLQRLEVAILRADPALDLTPAAPPTTAPPGTAPPTTAPTATATATTATATTAPLVAGGSATPIRQAPPDLPGFTGRDDQLAELDTFLPATVVISGPAGVGKTALAVHWAHLAADRFPDGQLYVNLRGFDPSGAVLGPAEAVRGFLDAFAVAPQRMPTTVEAQVALYRSLLAGKRILVLLDNARDADQVRPLLPTSPTAMALVTSRNQLMPLVAVDGAHPLPLDVLSDAGAWDLLTRRIGAERVTAEPAAVHGILTACARLPLALSIAAARARLSRFPLAALATELGGTGQPLDALDGGDASSDVRAVFSWSLTAVTPQAARVFRLLGLHPGPDVTVAATASLAGLPGAQVQRLLTELVRASLLVEHAPGRYGCHDLLRAYAADLAASTDSADDRRAATGRLLDHLLHSAYAAEQLINPHRDPVTLPMRPPAPEVRPETPADTRAATAWLSAERAVLLAAIRHAGRTGFDWHAWQLAARVTTFLFRRAQWRDNTMAWRYAAQAAERLGDLPAQAEAYRCLGHSSTMLGRYPDAAIHLLHAIDLARRAGDLAGQARIQYNLSYLHERQGSYQQALHHAVQALELRRAGGNLRGLAMALNAVGWSHTLLGEHAKALVHCEQALDLYRQLDNRLGQAAAWDSIGHAHHRLGHLGEAVECYQRAIALSRELGDRFNEADALVHLGDVRNDAGDTAGARAAWTRALTILTELDHPDAAQVRARLPAGWSPATAGAGGPRPGRAGSRT